MRITAIREVAVPINSSISNAVFDFSEMTTSVVLAKRDAAQAWVAAVNASPNVAQKWGYILASESVIGSATNWNALKNGAGAFTS